MAEIHVERKRGVGAWVWVLLVVIVVLAVCAYLWYAGYIHLGMSSFAPRNLALLGSSGGIHGA